MRLQLMYFVCCLSVLKKNIVHKALKIIKNISINVSKSISIRRGILIKKNVREREISVRNVSKVSRSVRMLVELVEVLETLVEFELLEMLVEILVEVLRSLVEENALIENVNNIIEREKCQ